ncbi:MAG: PEP-CTERM sorting domain-containing protein [Pseudomonadota bacterium]
MRVFSTAAIAVCGSGLLATQAAALIAGTDNFVQIDEFLDDFTEEFVEFTVSADGVVDFEEDFGDGILGYPHSFDATFAVTSEEETSFDAFDRRTVTGQATSGSFIITVADIAVASGGVVAQDVAETVFLSGAAVDGEVTYIVDTSFDGEEFFDVVGEIDGFMLFDEVFSDVFDVDAITDDDGLLLAEIFGGLEVASAGVVPLNFLSQSFITDAFIDYVGPDLPPSGEVPLPAALPMLGLGLGLLGWTRSRRRKAA